MDHLSFGGRRDKRPDTVVVVTLKSMRINQFLVGTISANEKGESVLTLQTSSGGKGAQEKLIEFKQGLSQLSFQRPTGA